MKIGIVTFWKSEDNYGEVLQALALYKYLENKGHRCFIVKYTEEKNTTLLSKIFTLISLLKNPKAFFNALKKKYTPVVVYQKEERFFNEFRNKWMRFSKEYTHCELINCPPEADAYVCGSDQIWGGLDPIMYLSFVPQDCKKIAFAPSFGGLIPNQYTKQKIKKYIEKFDLISCRENSGVNLCKLLGRKDTLLFPDPTLMHQSIFYDKFIADVKYSQPYIFVYLLGNEMSFDTKIIFDFANKYKLDIVFVTGQNGIKFKGKTYPATIEEWISGIKNAEYVITNSFHGTVFSLLYHKKFMTIPLSGSFSRMNVRINELLGKHNLLHRIYHGKLDEIIFDIDYSKFDSKHLEDIERVNIILQDVL